MSVLALKLFGVAALIGVAVSMCFYYRRVFRTESSSISAKDARMIFISISLMAIGALTGLWAILESPVSQRLVFTLLPLLVLTGYGLEIFLLTRLSAHWKRSPLLWIAALPPLVGCVLVALILWREHRESE